MFYIRPSTLIGNATSLKRKCFPVRLWGWVPILYKYLMKINEIITESKSADLYHGTSLDNALAILESNTMEPGDSSHGDEGAVSFTRSFGEAWNFAQWADPLGVIFIFNQAALAQTLGRKLQPFDYGGGHDEQEELSSIAINNISNYIKQIVVLWRDGAEDEFDADDYATVLNDPRTVVVSQDDFNDKTTGRQFLMQLHRSR